MLPKDAEDLRKATARNGLISGLQRTVQAFCRPSKFQPLLSLYTRKHPSILLLGCFKIKRPVGLAATTAEQETHNTEESKEAGAWLGHYDRVESDSAKSGDVWISPCCVGWYSYSVCAISINIEEYLPDASTIGAIRYIR